MTLRGLILYIIFTLFVNVGSAVSDDFMSEISTLAANIKWAKDCNRIGTIREINLLNKNIKAELSALDHDAYVVYLNEFEKKVKNTQRCKKENVEGVIQQGQEALFSLSAFRKNNSTASKKSNNISGEEVELAIRSLPNFGICSFSTRSRNGLIEWNSEDPESLRFITEAKRRGLTCDVNDSS